MSSKIIIVTTLILLIFGFSLLFIVETRNHNYDFKKNWSVVYFANPGDNSLDFAIENHQGEKIDYGYKVIAGDQEIGNGNIELNGGEKKVIVPETNSNLSGQKIIIIISEKDREYKIYKNLKE